MLNLNKCLFARGRMQCQKHKPCSENTAIFHFKIPNIVHYEATNIISFCLIKNAVL